MSLFNSFLKKNDNTEPAKSKLNWNYLTDLEQLNEINTNSYSQQALIFKHSTQCNISKMALKQFENELESEAKVTLYFLDLLENRIISAAIATKFNVEHQSPQLLLIKNGVAVYNVSHSEIDAHKLAKIL